MHIFWQLGMWTYLQQMTHIDWRGHENCLVSFITWSQKMVLSSWPQVLFIFILLLLQKKTPEVLSDTELAFGVLQTPGSGTAQTGNANPLPPASHHRPHRHVLRWRGTLQNHFFVIRSFIQTTFQGSVYKHRSIHSMQIFSLACINTTCPPRRARSCRHSWDGGLRCSWLWEQERLYVLLPLHTEEYIHRIFII